MKPAALAGLLLTGLAAAASARDEAAFEVRGHPRLLADESAFSALRDRAEADAALAGVVRAIEGRARALIQEPPVAYHKTGRRLLAVSRTVLERVGALAFAYRMTGERALAERAEREMLAAAAFSDWNPSHFLDVAEMTTALALGYDWLHDALSPESRVAIRRALVEKGLRPALDPTRSFNSWQQRENNWNQVCWGGLTLGALAIADEEPEIARDILALARANIRFGLAPYAPDGVYPEGPGYWAYGTTYQVLMIAALETALGTDWGLSSSPGFLESARFVLQATGPSGVSYNFADGAERQSLDPVMFWFARRLHDPGLLSFHARALRAGTAAERAGRFGPLAALWWTELPQPKSEPALPLRWRSGGVQPIGVFRSSWTDPDALYLAFKGGSASLNHAHMDAGSFVLEADGVRWARDLGAQDYNSLESKGVDLWNRRQDSQRWTVYRLNNRSHNTLTIDDQLQRVDGSGRIVRFEADAAEPFAVLDLSSVYAGQAASVKRGFRLTGSGVTVQDELTGLRSGARVRWALLTGADVSVDGARATLREEGGRLEARVLVPTNVSFAVGPAQPPRDDYNAPNPDRRLLTVTVVAPEDGALRLAVRLTPSSLAVPAAPAVGPLDDWR